MDTIIFFYQKRGLKEPQISLADENGCRLIRVGIWGGEDDWFGQKLKLPGETGAGNTDGARTEETYKKKGKRVWLARLRERIEERRDRRSRAKEQEALTREYKRTVAETESAIRELVGKICAEAGDAECACAYTDGAEKMLCRGRTLPELWKRHWNVPLFVDYKEFRWAEPLLGEAGNPAFLILGTAPCLPEVIKHCAGRMKSLEWILPEKDFGEKANDFLEDIYEDYGLAVRLELLPPAGGLLLFCPKSTKPCTVLDFTEEGRAFADGLAAGSIWIDFTSDGEKEGRLQRYTEKIFYNSLKKHWRGLENP